MPSANSTPPGAHCLPVCVDSELVRCVLHALSRPRPDDPPARVPLWKQHGRMFMHEIDDEELDELGRRRRHIARGWRSWRSWGGAGA